jgi:uncharacterized protein YecT (DUF1311 family)
VPIDAPLSERDPGGFIEKAMSMETLEGYAKQIRAKHALFVFDACFSGTFFKMRAAPEVIALKTAQPVRQFITSGSAEQSVPDVSVFRREFVAGLEGEADLNHDGYVTGSELGSYLEDKVTQYSHQTQTPQYGKIQDRTLDKGDFVFLPAAAEAKPQAVATVADAPGAPALRLDDIQAEARRRADWDAWQTRMRADFAKIAALPGGTELKASAWERFLAAYTAHNPYSNEADTLREQARREMQAPRARMADRPVFPPEYARIRGPSFNCDVRLTPLETLLCRVPRLAHLDGVMGTVYRQLYERTADKDDLKRSQRAWLIERNSACSVIADDLGDPMRRDAQIECLQGQIGRAHV